MGVFGLAPALSSPAVCAAAHYRSIDFVNQIAGDGFAPEAAQIVANINRVEFEAEIYETPKNERERLLAMTELIRLGVKQQAQTPQKPLYLLAWGGDGTFNDMVRAYYRYLFPERDVWTISQEEMLAAQRMNTNVRLGTVGMGTANDEAFITGAPMARLKKDDALDPPQLIGDVITYLDDAVTVSHNMGVARFEGHEDGVIFSHNASAGTTFARLFELTGAGHGKKALKERRLEGVKLVWNADPFDAVWETSTGESGTVNSREVMAHSTALADTVNGFPGTAQPGLGIKIFPHRSFAGIVPLFLEVRLRGLISRIRKPWSLRPSQRLLMLSQNLQPPLPVGQEIRFHFPKPMPVQISGDFMGHSRWLTLNALPPLDNVMAMEGSLLHSLSLLQALPE